MKAIKLMISSILLTLGLVVSLFLFAQTESLTVYYFDPLLNTYSDVTLSFVSNTETTLSAFEGEAVEVNGLSMIKFSSTSFRYNDAQLKLTYTTTIDEVETPHSSMIPFTLDDAYKTDGHYTYYLRNESFYQTALELNNDILYAAFDTHTINNVVVSFKVIHPISDLSKITLTQGDEQLPVRNIRQHGDTYFFNTDEIDYKQEYLLSIDFLENEVISYYVRYDWLYSEGSFTSKYNYYGDDLGVHYTQNYTVFKLWAPLLSHVKLNIYGASGDKQSYAMNEGSFGVFQLHLSGNLKNKEYTYSFTRYGIEHEIIDPNANYINDTNTRGIIVNPVEATPANFKDHQLTFSGTYVDAVIYETSIRQMTESQKVNGLYTNTFYALSRINTTLPSNPQVKTGINHLVDLGITHAAFNDLFDTRYSFRAPDNRYRIRSNDTPGSMSELKTLIKNLNNHDIGVIVDLDIHQPVIESLELLMPGYYYEHQDGDILKTDGKATFNMNHYMANDYIKSSIVYLTEEYNLAGVKLSPLNQFNIDDVNMIYPDIEKEKPNYIIYGEFGSEPLYKTNKISPTNLRSVSLIGVVDTRFKVDNNFFGSGGHDLKAYLLKEPNSQFQTTSINQTFNLLPNLNSYTRIQRQQASLMNLLSFGVPVIKVGEEFGHYDTTLTYDYPQSQRSFYEAYKGLIHFRQTQKTFKFEKHSDVKKMVLYKQTDGLISIQITNLDNQYPELLLLYNNGLEHANLILPVGLDTEEARKENDKYLDWRVLFSDVDGYDHAIYDSEDEIEVKKNQTLLLHFGEITGKKIDLPPRIPAKPSENSNAMLITFIFLGLGIVVSGLFITYFILKTPEKK